MHRFSPTGLTAINKGYVVRLSGKRIGLNGFKFKYHTALKRHIFNTKLVPKKHYLNATWLKHELTLETYLVTLGKMFKKQG